MAENGIAPPPPEFCKVILSKRGFQAASFNRCCLQYVRLGVSLWQPVTYATILNLKKIDNLKV